MPDIMGYLSGLWVRIQQNPDIAVIFFIVGILVLTLIPQHIADRITRWDRIAYIVAGIMLVVAVFFFVPAMTPPQHFAVAVVVAAIALAVLGSYFAPRRTRITFERPDEHEGAG